MRPHRVLALPALALGLLLAGCRSAPADSNPLELRTYDVPKGAVRPLLATIKDALWMEDKKSVGRATMTPDGRIAVLAPENVQAGVAKLVEKVGTSPAALDQTITLHYFVVIGKPAASPAPVPRGLADVQPALDEIVKSQGPQEFTLATRIGLSSLNDETGRLDGDDLEIRQQAVETGDGVYAALTMRYGRTNKLETRVRLVQDGIVVLGAMGRPGGDAPEGATLYYLVRIAPRAHGKQR